jgi:hypothetical protein
MNRRTIFFPAMARELPARCALFAYTNIVLLFSVSFYFTRIPGVAPSWGSKINIPLFSGPEAASIMPSERPNRIFRGARFATTTVSLPIKFSGA